MSGKLYRAMAYGLDKAEEIDFAEVERLATETSPS